VVHDRLLPDYKLRMEMIMARAYYSTVFTRSADELWSDIRDFNNYLVWVDGSGESEIEDGKSGDAVGAGANNGDLPPGVFRRNRIFSGDLHYLDVRWHAAGAPSHCRPKIFRQHEGMLLKCYVIPLNRVYRTDEIVNGR
jgi:hypothetical protein